MFFRFRHKKKAEALPVEQAIDQSAPQPMNIHPDTVGSITERKIARPIEPYRPPPGVVPTEQLSALMAMDSTPYEYVTGTGGISGDVGFPGYPYLAQLSQLPEYRKMVGTIAGEMTRKWIKLTSVGDDDKSDKIKVLNEAIEKFHVRERLKKAIEHDGFFGRGQIYIDVRTSKGVLAATDPVELESRLFLSPKKITKGSLIGFNVIEPIWTYPGIYNANNPLSNDFYKPSSWYVMAKTVHDSRLITFITRPLTDMLKPAYNFGGLSLTQIAESYVQNWYRTRDSVSDLIHSFSVSGFKTNLQSTLQGQTNSPDQLIYRAELFNKMRDNRGVMMLDNEEEFFQFNTPLSGLDSLQAQSQEHMSSVSSIPLVIFTGITPSGLNASSDGEIRVFYDFIATLQMLVKDGLARMIDIIQLSEFGEIDPDISFTFEPLYQMTDEQKANIRKTDADTDSVLIAANVISTDEARERLANDENSPYHSLEINDIENDSEDVKDSFNDDDDISNTEHKSDHDSQGMAKESLNGAQVSSIVDVVTKYAEGLLSLESAIAIVTTAFPIDEDDAKKLFTGITAGSIHEETNEKPSAPAN
ncbi:MULTISPECIES: DUF1073 domain-containing protein [Photorhabdus]|uniref:Anti-CBASS protein Acb1-like N-terminal domain-containing protein n=1 Tax=Photorhabdus luminescens TaxID=29488 RepID=A0A1G5Q395_PHOLU|nr:MULTISPECIES: DUF1073 domain-containing protein [Photorhabdus]SCZ55779.1 hypothetical protein SAMN02982990_00815 [Photorhabdus luminescens]